MNTLHVIRVMCESNRVGTATPITNIICLVAASPGIGVN